MLPPHTKEQEQDKQLRMHTYWQSFLGIGG